MNYPLRLTDKTVTPDMMISLTATQGPTKVVLISYLGETALSETWDHVFEKMEFMIARHLKVLFTLIGTVYEAKCYTSPPDGDSTASKTLHNRKNTNLSAKLKPFSLKEFIIIHSMPRDIRQ
jgi:hypothetical protein